MDIRLIATDLDGTFLSGYNKSRPQAHPENIKALRLAQKEGIRVCACTGRHWGGCCDLVREYGFDDFCVTNNGCSIVDVRTGKHRYRNRIAPEALSVIFAACEVYGIPYMVFGHEMTYYSRSVIGEFSQRRREHIDRLAREGRCLIADNREQLVQLCAEDTEKLSVYPLDEPLQFKLYKTIEQFADIEVASDGPNHAEITSRYGTKGEALSMLADIYEVRPEQVMALGDNYNDVHMLLWAGTGVAMGNGDSSIRSIADYVTDINTNAGWARAVYAIALHD